MPQVLRVSPVNFCIVRIFSVVLMAFLYFDICHYHSGKYQNMEKPLKHQKRLGLTFVWRHRKAPFSHTVLPFKNLAVKADCDLITKQVLDRTEDNIHRLRFK